jgi:cytochrome c553
VSSGSPHNSAGRRIARLIAVAAAIAGSALAQDADRNQALVGVCISCHAAAGTAGSEEIPALVGQNEAFLYEALKDFKEGSRPSAQMRGIARELSDAELRYLARHFAVQPYLRGLQPAEAERAARGKEVYLRLCQICHLDEGRSTTYADYPLLAGQSLPYMLKEMRLILDKRRRVEIIKHEMLELVSRQQIDDAIHFFAAQRVAPGDVGNSVTTPGKRTKRNRFRTDLAPGAAE